MSVFICTNLLSGNTGLDKSVVMTANAFYREGIDVSVINFVGPSDGTKFLMPNWPFDLGLPVRPLQTLPAQGGRLLHSAHDAVLANRIPNLSYSFSANSFAALKQLNRALTAEDAIVFTHPLQAQVFGRAIGDDKRHCFTMMQIHGDYRARHPELRPMLLDARATIDDLQVVSRGLEDDYLEDFTADQIHWIPNIHTPTRVLPKPSKKVRIALIGSFQDAKNQLDAVRMMSRIKSSDVELLLWGNNNNSYGKHVQATVEQLKLDDVVLFAGVGTEQDIYGSADIVIIPSRSEGFGYALVEAASHSVPVVAYDYNYGPRDVIEEGQSGFIVPEGDIDRLAERVNQLVHDEPLRRKLGSRAKEIFNATFASARIMERYGLVLGPHSAPTAPSLDDLFPEQEDDPVDESSLTTRQIRLKGRSVFHILSFQSSEPLKNFAIASVNRQRTVHPIRLGSKYYLPVLTGDPGKSAHKALRRVITFGTAKRDAGRFYLGNTTNKRAFEVCRHMLRSPGTPNPSLLRADGSLACDTSDIHLPDFEVADGRLRIARHPRKPATSALDSFGVAANLDKSYTLSNSADVRAPTVLLRGEFDSVSFALGSEVKTFASPFSYAELFDTLLEVEREADLFGYEIPGGIRPWELYRAAFVATLCEALGLWGPQFTKSLPTWDTYTGSKTLTDITGHKRILFEFPRKVDGPDPRTESLQDNSSLIIEYPQSFGYSSGIYTQTNRYPIREFNLWRQQANFETSGFCDSRPVEGALSKAFGFPISIGPHLDRRVKKFREERDFWTPIFQKAQPDEVVIPSSHWSAGICEAANRAGAVAADTQYALTSRYHPSYWFGAKPHHGAQRLYAWSDFWAPRTNAYEETKRLAKPSEPPILSGKSDDHYDFCVISQPRVTRRIFRFAAELAAAKPDSLVCIAPHPDERSFFAERAAELSQFANVRIAPVSTIDAVHRSSICIGGYSTSMYEAAALGKPVYVLPVPGHEIALEDVESGLFRRFETNEELVDYTLPDWHSSIFGSPE